MKTLATLLVLAALATSCKDSDISQLKALSKRHRITMYACDGKVIKQWTSTGSVSNESQSDGYFEDEETHRLVEVTGHIVIEVLP
jgi:hypothetical protein